MGVKKVGLILCFCLIFGCTSKELKLDPTKNTGNDEFSKVVKIEPTAEVASPATSAVPTKSERVKKISKKKKGKKETPPGNPLVVQNEPPVDPSLHQPELEGQGNFIGRRPKIDPFHVGEKLTYDITYYFASAGRLILETLPFVQVNGHKSYSFKIAAQSDDWFASVYTVDDAIDVLMDFEQMVPTVFLMHLKESGQLKEAKSYFDFNTKKAKYWERKVTKRDGEEEKSEEWDILDYSQNLFSGAYYARVFDWKEGEERSFRVSDDKQNLIFRGKCLRKEKIKTKAGEFNAYVIQPKIELQGKYKPIGDIYMWLSDDEHKYLLRLELKIAIGSLKADIISID